MPDDCVTLRAYTANLAGDRWRYVVTARDGALRADVPDRETAERFLCRWSEMDGRTPNVVCGWCGMVLPYDAEVPDGKVSHGTCDECAATFAQEEG